MSATSCARGALDRLGFGGRRGGGHLAEGAEQHVGERAVHRLAHDHRQDEARRAVERAGDDQQLVVEHEAHRHRRQPGVGVQQRDDRRHVGAADGQDQQHAEGERQHDHDREQLPRLRAPHHVGARGQRDQRQQPVEDVLVLEGDGPRRQHFLELAGGHQAAGERQVAEQHLDDDREHAERGEPAVLEPQHVLRRADQARRQAAEGVRQRRPLRHRGERHPRQRHADDRADRPARRRSTCS